MSVSMPTAGGPEAHSQFFILRVFAEIFVREITTIPNRHHLKAQNSSTA